MMLFPIVDSRYFFLTKSKKDDNHPLQLIDEKIKDLHILIIPMYKGHKG